MGRSDAWCVGWRGRPRLESLGYVEGETLGEGPAGTAGRECEGCPLTLPYLTSAEQTSVAQDAQRRALRGSSFDWLRMSGRDGASRRLHRWDASTGSACLVEVWGALHAGGL